MRGCLLSLIALVVMLPVLASCSSVPDSPYRPSDAGIVASQSTDGQGVLHYQLTDGRSWTLDPRVVRFIGPGPNTDDLLLRGETSDGPWAYGLLNKQGDCWVLQGGGEVRDGRLATSQKLSLAFAPGFDPSAHGGPQWVTDRGFSFCLNEKAEVVSIRRD